MRRRLSRAAVHGLARLIVPPCLFLIAMAGHAGYQASPPSPGPGTESFHISVDVALVVLDATVTDHQGSLVSDLEEQDFTVFEDGVAQEIKLFKHEDFPITVGMVVDHSTTMRPKIAEVTTAARTFARSSNPDDEMFVVNFNEKVSLGLPRAGRFTNSSTKLEEAISTGVTGGLTALYDAVSMGLTELRAGQRDKKALIVVSDGGDNASRCSLEQVMKLAGESSAAIYTIGVFDASDEERNPAVLKRLARATGGEAFFPRELEEVAPLCERIARDIRHQYTIGYVPSKPARDGSYRAIRVQARPHGHGHLSVRTRTGYIATGGQSTGGKIAQ